jgi:hypothetical protein
MPAAFVPAAAPETAQRMLEGLDPDLRSLARPLLPWLVLRHELSKSVAGAPKGSSSSVAPSTASACFGAVWSREEAEVTELLSSPPSLAPRTKLPVLSEDLLSRYLGPLRPMAGLTELNLHDCGLKKIEGLVSLRGSLRVLVLTFNEIARIEGVREWASGGGPSPPARARFDLGQARYA